MAHFHGLHLCQANQTPGEWLRASFACAVPHKSSSNDRGFFHPRLSKCSLKSSKFNCKVCVEWECGIFRNPHWSEGGLLSSTQGWRQRCVAEQRVFCNRTGQVFKTKWDAHQNICRNARWERGPGVFINNGPMPSNSKLGYTWDILAANTDSKEAKGTLGLLCPLVHQGGSKSMMGLPWLKSKWCKWHLLADDWAGRAQPSLLWEQGCMGSLWVTLSLHTAPASQSHRIPQAGRDKDHPSPTSALGMSPV